MATLYASFATPDDADRAAGALLDHGALTQDIAMLAGETTAGQWSHPTQVETQADTGISTTTAGDAAYGAVKGSVIGLGVGALVAVGSLLIPGVGIVLGGGALATALAGTLGSAAAGAAAGGVAGFLKDQGVGDEIVTRYSEALNVGGSLMSVNVPTGRLDDMEVEQILAKYGATNVCLTGGDRSLMDHEERVPMDSGIPSAGPVNRVVSEEVVPVTRTTLGTTPSTPGALMAAANAVEVNPTIIDPVTGAMREGVAVDPLTGIERPVQVVQGAVVYQGQTTPLEPVPATGFTLADVVATTIDPGSGVVSEGYVTDSAGVRRNVRVVNGSIIYADMP
jgi:hypothetical protein